MSTTVSPSKKSQNETRRSNHERNRRGQSFRLGMYFPSEEAATAAFNALEQGTAKLQDYVEFFDTVPGEHKEDVLEYL